jgi:hypothetical protein
MNNYLETLKIKPNIKTHKLVDIIIPELPINSNDPTQQPIITMIDERHKGFNIELFKNRLESQKLLKVRVNPIVAEVQKINEPIKQIEPVKSNKNVNLKIILEDEEENAEETALTEKPIRQTKKVEKGVAVLGPEINVVIDNRPITNFLPKKQPNVIIKISDYYMNNREKYINNINSIFQPYKKELSQTENITCNNIGKSSGNVSLLLHQKITRDYLNLYTPYRGLLLYHGLGSGKTCTSIAIAEGMKDHKKIIIMTPASLRKNYMVELKKCGDLLFRRNQFWKWVSINTNPELLPALSSVLNLPIEYIQKKNGAWFVNVSEPANYASMSGESKQSLDEQLDKMIESKYTFINYNGLRNTALSALTDNYTKNLFDGAVVIIDEAHNLISRIVNKLQKEKEIEVSNRGVKEHQSKFLSLKLYEYLMSAVDSRIICLTGTPVINYPNEFGILFNVLRGYIKTWEFPLQINTSKKIDKFFFEDLFLKEKTLDYIDYSPSSKMLTITRNPFGFKNVNNKSGYHGVTHEKKNEQGELVLNNDFISDNDFERKIISILKQNDIEILSQGIKIKNFKALPDKLDLFSGEYIDDATKELKNVDGLKRRIIGLSSYFRSAQEDLLPKFTKTLSLDYFIVNIEMSDFQFKIYEKARVEERKTEKPKKGKGAIYEEAASTYRIFSRLYCNYVMPNRPLPRGNKDVKGDEESDDYSNMVDILKETKKIETNIDVTNLYEGEVEGDELINNASDVTYQDRIEKKIQFIKDNPSTFLSPEGLQTYSPKFLHILENIKDPEYIGLHLIYSQFRTLEGVGIFSLVLEANGFNRFKIKKTGLDTWDLDMDDLTKPAYALYTGTETSEEKEIIRNIYNSSWDDVPTNISNKLKEISKNNNYGEIIKVLMITSSGSEGINLRNTRYVHIMEPYWHPVRTEQVIGRARRICSHNDLPKELQTVVVFIYLMTFSEKQLKSDDAIELKRKDLSKKLPAVPVTSDQLLFETATIKEKLSNQLTKIIKETSFDCSIYPHGKEKITCMNFADPDSSKFSYVPDYSKQQSDNTLRTNKREFEWTGQSITINGVQYIYREVNKNLLNIYDFDSYQQALLNKGFNPIQVGTYEINENGSDKFKPIVN